MSRHLWLLAWFCLGLFGIAGVEFAYAEGTLPAGPSGYKCTAGGTTYNAGVSCQQAYDQFGGQPAVSVNTITDCGGPVSNVIGQGIGYGHLCSGSHAVFFWNGASWVYGSLYVTPVAACPANSTGPTGTAPNQVCTCDYGFNPENGQCVQRSCPIGQTAEGFKAGAVMTSTAFCWSGCEYKASSSTCGTFAEGSGCIFWGGKSTGNVCNTSTNATTTGETSASCAAKGMGSATVNGVTTCAAAGPGSPVTTNTGSASTTTNPDNSISSSSSTTSSSDSGNGGVSTTTTTTGPNGTTTTTTDQSKSSFCEQNPNSPLCNEQQDPCTDNPERLSCAEFGEAEDPGELTTKTDGAPSSISPVSVASNNTCPASIALPKGMSLDFNGMCQVAEGIRPIVLAMAWLAAGLLLVGAFRES